MRLALLALTLAPLTASAATWSTSPIDDQTGWTVSLQVDEAFHAHAAYWSPYGGFKYSFFNGAAWELDTIPATQTLEGSESAATRAATPAAAQLIMVGRTSLAVTPETPWVAHMKVDDTNYEDGLLKVSHKADGAWVTEDIDPYAVSTNHIAANDEGTIYLVYLSRMLGPRLAIRNGTWTNEALDLSYGPYALTIDRNGTPWILYTDGTTLWVARRDGPGVWSPLMVDNTPGLLRQCSSVRFPESSVRCIHIRGGGDFDLPTRLRNMDRVGLGQHLDQCGR